MNRLPARRKGVIQTHTLLRLDEDPCQPPDRHRPPVDWRKVGRVSLAVLQGLAVVAVTLLAPVFRLLAPILDKAAIVFVWAVLVPGAILAMTRGGGVSGGTVAALVLVVVVFATVLGLMFFWPRLTQRRVVHEVRLVAPAPEPTPEIQVTVTDLPRRHAPQIEAQARWVPAFDESDDEVLVEVNRGWTTD